MPTWVAAMDVPATVDSLRQAFPNQGALVDELRRLNLVSDVRHTNTGNLHDVRRERVLEVATSIIGPDEVARILDDLALAA